MPRPHPFHLVHGLIAIASFYTVVGWGLSALHRLTPLNYLLLTLGFGGVVATLYRRDLRLVLPLLCKYGRRSWRRCRKPLPCLVYIAILLNFVGGASQLPTNYDGLTYRIPRLLYWFANQGWFWIPTSNQRMNLSGTGQEWLLSPLYAFSHSDRPFFLLNSLIFLAFPGLVFTVLRRLGVSGRLAWWWMWLLPLSYGFLLHAGGIGNDWLGAFWFLVAIALTLPSDHPTDRLRCQAFTYSLLAIALCTGVKASNVPLVLPWAVGWGCQPGAGRWLRDWVKRPQIWGIAAIAGLVSGLPSMVLNHIHTGSWTGDPNNTYGVAIQNPLAGLLGNGVLIMAQNLVPPIFPLSDRLETVLNQISWFAPGSWLRQAYPRFQFLFNELPQEEASGLGLITLLFLLWLLIASHQRPNAPTPNAPIPNVPPRPRPTPPLRTPLLLAHSVAALIFLAKMGSESSPRLFLPYYPLVVATVLGWCGDSSVTRTRAWQWAGCAAAGLAIAIQCLTPSRPLLPMQAIFAAVRPVAPAALVERAQVVYQTYRDRADIFRPIRQQLTATDRVVGFMGGGNDLETSLWRPFGSRQIVAIQPQSDRATLRQLGVRKAVLSQAQVQALSPSATTQLSWLLSAPRLATVPIRQLASEPPSEFWLVAVDP